MKYPIGTRVRVSEKGRRFEVCVNTQKTGVVSGQCRTAKCFLVTIDGTATKRAFHEDFWEKA